MIMTVEGSSTLWTTGDEVCGYVIVDVPFDYWRLLAVQSDAWEPMTCFHNSETNHVSESFTTISITASHDYPKYELHVTRFSLAFDKYSAGHRIPHFNEAQNLIALFTIRHLTLS